MLIIKNHSAIYYCKFELQDVFLPIVNSQILKLHILYDNIKSSLKQ